MAGRFEGLSDLEWKLFEDIFPKQVSKRGKGMPHAPYRNVLNSLLYILITGCRWCDLPRGDIWASKSSSHLWLKRWRSDGTLKNRGRPIKISVSRFRQERCFAWYQRKYRRLVVRWERQKVYFDAFIDLATIHIWINKILLVG